MPGSPSLHLDYRPDLDLLTGRWLFDPDPEQLRQDYEDLLKEGLYCGAQRWLLDLRRRPALPVGLTDWMETTWLPHLLGVAPPDLRIAFWLPPQREVLRRAAPALNARVEELLRQPGAYRLRLFENEALALAWLLAPAGT
ncbi:hypothetical protein JAO73_03445 [Hymenobacter sp. BT523]|uniref:hypothetical protein n=1 Tax=Hymenobacter sp. BT523 TaxID=2795725 RepID=UPI0018EA70CE|nr:hypothetical protein [Hymenobacter sp. BT523]MBJ6108052.1 hypothetical protein [Hymenobacter sp. BT523]